MPTPWRIIRLVVCALVLSVSFVVYAPLRGGWTLGLDLEACGGSLCVTALLVAIAVSWIVLVDVLLVSRAEARLQRLLSEGRCVVCGYPRGPSLSERCPECGRAGESRGWRGRAGRSTMRFAGLLLVATIAGSVAGESWLLAEEIIFRQEVRRRIEGGAPGQYFRARWWPGGGNALVYDPDSGFHVTD